MGVPWNVFEDIFSLCQKAHKHSIEAPAPVNGYTSCSTKQTYATQLTTHITVWYFFEKRDSNRLFVMRNISLMGLVDDDSDKIQVSFNMQYLRSNAQASCHALYLSGSKFLSQNKPASLDRINVPFYPTVSAYHWNITSKRVILR